VHSPIDNRTIENIVGNTGKRSGQTAYTPRTDAIPDIKATGMENKDTQEGTTPADTPYCSGYNIDDIPKNDIATLKEDIVTSKYQSLVVSLLWLAYVTRPDL
jgi:hypothetical protein